MSHHTVLHLPHASDHVPPEVRDQFILTDEELSQEIVRLTDWYTDDLFHLDLDTVAECVFPVSRFVVDPERFEDDSEEPMASRGMGVIYQKTTWLNTLRRDITAEEREHLLETYYRPHHASLTTLVDTALLDHGRCLVVDCHSFPDKPLKCNEWHYPDEPSADICLGTDKFHTPAPLLEIFKAAFESCGWSVSVDKPFKGALVPMKHYQKSHQTEAIMIEINRRLYLSPGSSDRSGLYPDTRERIQGVMRDVLENWTPQNARR